MAARIKMFKLLQEMHGFAAISNRRPKPRSPGLVLAQMRPTVIQAVLPRRKLSVATDKSGRSNLPHPVKINHLTPNPGPSATLPAA
jgi:hypothetical protein